ncbi:MAG: hypothetical protein PHD02_02375 [Bacilli bacterium]|nr:hypothetical protein [Bacilli bacterium]
MSKIYDKYKELKKKDSNKLYLIKCGKFYIFVDKDCDYINNYIVLKKVLLTKDVYKCGFPVEKVEDYLKVFKNQGIDIEVVANLDLVEKNKTDINQYIKNIDIDNLTPKQALDILYEIRGIVNE